MNGSDIRHHPNFRVGDFRQRRDLSGMRHAHFNHRRVVLLLQPKQRQRQAKMIVEVSFRFQHAKREERTWAIASFVVVLPVEPVTPISGLPHKRRTAVARVCNATRVSSTERSWLPDEYRLVWSWRMTAATAPLLNACSTKSCPSSLSPFTAKKRSPG